MIWWIESIVGCILTRVYMVQSMKLSEIHCPTTEDISNFPCRRDVSSTTSISEVFYVHASNCWCPFSQTHKVFSNCGCVRYKFHHVSGIWPSCCFSMNTADVWYRGEKTCIQDSFYEFLLSIDIEITCWYPAPHILEFQGSATCSSISFRHIVSV
jgi:hypothetical protein